MEEIVKKYLEDYCATDTVLAEKYNADMMPECTKYIHEMAVEMNQDMVESLAIERATVFKWARDFFVEGKAALEEEKARKAEEQRIENEKIRAEKEKAQIEKERYDREHANGQMTIFDIAGV